MAERIDVVVVGGGQAGLATSHELTELGVEHVVLEREKVASSWRRRWESFCLVTPNWSVNLPGGAYDGDDPDGYLPRDEIVTFFERYARSFDAPVREGVDVTALQPRGAGFLLRTPDGEIASHSVVVATGAYQRPFRPAAAATMPSGILQLDADDYRDPASLPDGRVLVVGSGQTGCQIAEELHETGRDVVLSCGRAPWAPRRLGDRDIVWWAVETGFFDQPVSALPAPSARLAANIQNTGHGGGHTLNYRTLRAAGVTLVGHLVGADDHRATFAPDLAESVSWGDDRYRELMASCHRCALERGLPMPEMPEPEPFDATAPEELDLRDVGAVVFAGGFRSEYGSWIPVPEAFDDLGFPLHHEGTSSIVPGLFFVGVHFLRTRKSSLLWGVGEDAAIVARHVSDRGTA